MAKLDLKKDFKKLYGASAKEPVIVEVPTCNFLMLDGAGDPNTNPAFQSGAEALFALSYHLKFHFKKTQGVDYAVMPLEGLWWTDDMAAFSTDRKDLWQWTLMILQPQFITAGHVGEALAQVRQKKSLPALEQVRFAAYAEGPAAQILHLGPYADEPGTIARLHAFIQAKGYTPHGYHHEIYLSDPRRTAPARLKTILRQPVK